MRWLCKNGICGAARRFAGAKQGDVGIFFRSAEARHGQTLDNARVCQPKLIRVINNRVKIQPQTISGNDVCGIKINI